MTLKDAWNDQKIEDIIGNLLRIGVGTAAAVVLVGAAAYLVRHGFGHANYRVFRGEPSDLRTLRGIVRAAVGLHPRGIIQLGLVLLIATPVARVAFSVFAFAVERDRMYVVFTLMVLGILILSLAGIA
ncbi:MAG TPA: DUF1634 domain-containing protein [Terriglobales bacterium]|nr:DUF1634 domain-containing protein [Terriglobales bacterium]